MLPKIQNVLNFIGDNLSRELTVQHIAESVNLSRSRLQRLFKAEVGVPVIQYVRKHRVETAAVLLRTTSLSVKEIRGRVGMDDRSHFARDFKKAHGLTPSQFRNLGD